MSPLFTHDIEKNRRELLEARGFSFDKPKALAAAVLKLSDFYIQNPTASTPWHEAWAQAAYLSYYLPLNLIRSQNAARRAAQMGFFEGLQSAVDFGSGLGSGQIAVQEIFPQLEKMICHDISPIAMELHRRLLGAKGKNVEWTDGFTPSRLPAKESRLAILSYVFTELKALPEWARESEALFILEPSTRDDGRRLQQLRGDLISEGFTAFAPCTHQDACPLLAESGKDWCHHRVEFVGDEDWLRLEQELPIKNRTLTFSYLAIRKTAQPVRPNGPLARMIGDALPEKGKTRQMLCRGPHREFLSWFPARMKTEPELKRGDLVRFREGYEPLEMKANEVRVKDSLAIETVTLPETKL